MSEKRVTISLVQITQETRPEGLMIREVTPFRLPGFDYSQTCAALLAAKFEKFVMGLNPEDFNGKPGYST